MIVSRYFPKKLYMQTEVIVLHILMCLWRKYDRYLASESHIKQKATTEAAEQNVK